MPSRRPRRSPVTLAAQTAALAVAAPQVVAHRLTRLALAGPRPSKRDRREFHRMGTEKLAAFQESWIAMAAESWRIQQQIALGAVQALWFPWLAAGRAQAWPAEGAARAILGRGLAPVRRRAVANAKRLQRTRLR
jgi:hypothetical protein